MHLLETFVALSLFAIMLYISKKRDYVPNGELMPMLLTVYGILRFFIEFLHDNTKVLFGCSKLAFHALFMSIVGIILWQRKRRKLKQFKSADCFQTTSHSI